MAALMRAGGMALRPAPGSARRLAVPVHLCPARPQRQRASRAPLAVRAAAITSLPDLEAPSMKQAAAAGAAVAAAAAAVAGAHHWQLGALALRMIDLHVLGATMGATFKLGIVCALVSGLVRSKQIPADAGPALSKVSFSLLIPAMLFIRVAQIIASQPSPSVLLTVAAFTCCNVGMGTLIASTLAPLAERIGRPAVGSRSDEAAAAAAAAGGGSSADSGLARITVLASAFGSTFTLPVVFLTGMLPAAAADRALGYLALVLLAWSPLLWGIGPAVVKGPGSSGGSSSGSLLKRLATPPLLAVMCGALLGATPLGRALMAPTGAAAVQLLGPVGGGLLRSMTDVIRMLAGGALAAQSVVLATSLLQPPAAAAGSSGGGSGQQQAGSSGGGSGQQQAGGVLAAAKQLLLPSSAAEARVLGITAATRFLLLPSLMLGGVWGLQRAGLLPAAVVADPTLLLVLLVGSCMPSAQNLIILCSLRRETQAQAPLLARLLLKQYVYAAVPVSLWTSVFATWLGVPVIS